jgi:hypothetical protein
LALPEGSDVTGESKFSTLGADSLDTVYLYLSNLIYPGIVVMEIGKLQICNT